MKSIPYIKIIKIALGSAIAILLAQNIGLHYSASAGIITILSVQDTKKETLLIAFKRIVSFLIAILVSALVFYIQGYSPLSFGVFLFVFISISSLLNLFDCVPVNAVLITHFLAEKSMSLSLIKNECMLLFIGAGIAIILNSYIPRNQKKIKIAQKNIEEKMKSIIKELGNAIICENKEEKHIVCFEDLEKTLKIASKKAYENMNNTFIGETKYYIDYITMRKNQTIILKKIYNSINLLEYIPKQSYQLYDLLIKISNNYHEFNNVKGLLNELNKVRVFMKNEPLPTSRREFETRAILFIILNDIESFLEIKYKFVLKLTKQQIKTYWEK